MPPPSVRQRILVAGGGLAGIVAALRLAGPDREVVLVEAGPRLGGRAGSARVDGRDEDHSYHIAFPWYRNLLALITEVGVRDGWVASPAYHQLVAGEFPRYRPYRAVGTSITDFIGGLRTGVLPPAEGFLYFYFMIDSIVRARRTLARPDTSVDHALATRWYATPALRGELNRIFVTGHGTPTDRFSVHTWLRFLPGFAHYPGPMYWIPRGSLHETLVAPLARRLVAQGVVVRTGWRVQAIDTADGRASVVHLSTADGPVSLDTDQVVLALPARTVSDLAGDAVDLAGLDRQRIRALVHRPVPALHLHLRTRLAGLPAEHVALVESQYALSLIDVGMHRAGGTTSCLNIVVGAPGALVAAPAEQATAAVVEEARRFLPGLDPADVTAAVWQPHADAPLFSNEVGSWADRPGTRTRLPNLVLAGDWVRSFVDVASMEGAVVTGLLAAEAVRVAGGLPDPPIPVTALSVRPTVAAVVSRAVLAPLAVAAYRRSHQGQGRRSLDARVRHRGGGRRPSRLEQSTTDTGR
ncbi:MAG TPA: FAD-dependent oxidoreductase [Pilimelia sp.]|nr:FAD-dependent oxidoreductase [Pilimelia sp.]